MEKYNFLFKENDVAKKELDKLHKSTETQDTKDLIGESALYDKIEALKQEMDDMKTAAWKKGAEIKKGAD